MFVMMYYCKLKCESFLTVTYSYKIYGLCYIMEDLENTVHGDGIV